MDDSMVPERDASNAGYQAGDELVSNAAHDHDPQGSVMQLKTSMSAFNQQRTVVAKLSRYLNFLHFYSNGSTYLPT